MVVGDSVNTGKSIRCLCLLGIMFTASRTGKKFKHKDATYHANRGWVAHHVLQHIFSAPKSAETKKFRQPDNQSPNCLLWVVGLVMLQKHQGKVT